MGKKKMFMRILGRVVSDSLFIGGVSSVINTSTILASYFLKFPSLTAYDAADITNFLITGNDIQCGMKENYTIKNIAFANNENITYFLDYERCLDSQVGAFQSGSGFNMIIKKIHLQNALVIYGSFSGGNGSTLIEEVVLPNATNLSGTTHFTKTSFLKRVYIPKAVFIGDTTGDDSVFNGSNDLIKVYAEPTMQTINSGSPDGDLQYLTGTLLGSARYVTNFTPPAPITASSIGVVYGTLIQLVDNGLSLNTVDYFEVYVNGVYHSEVNLNEGILGLSPNTSYDITAITVDIFYNKSALSSIITQSTAVNFVIPTGNIISNWQMENNVLDAVGTNNGVATSITYEAGIVGQRAIFNGSNSKIVVADNNSLSFGNGVTDSPFTFIIPFRVTVAGTRIVLDKRNGSFAEYQVSINSSSLGVVLFSLGGTANFWNSSILFSPVVGVDYFWTITYDGSGSNTGLSYYLGNENLSYKINLSQVGSPSVMSNTTAPSNIGSSRGTSNFFNGRLDEITILNIELTNLQINELFEVFSTGNHFI